MLKVTASPPWCPQEGGTQALPPTACRVLLHPGAERGAQQLLPREHQAVGQVGLLALHGSPPPSSQGAQVGGKGLPYPCESGCRRLWGLLSRLGVPVLGPHPTVPLGPKVGCRYSSLPPHLLELCQQTLPQRCPSPATGWGHPAPPPAPCLGRTGHGVWHQCYGGGGKRRPGSIAKPPQEPSKRARCQRGPAQGTRTVQAASWLQRLGKGQAVPAGSPDAMVMVCCRHEYP